VSGRAAPRIISLGAVVLAWLNPVAGVKIKEMIRTKIAKRIFLALDMVVSSLHNI
jgi:hypothetical protein